MGRRNPPHKRLQDVHVARIVARLVHRRLGNESAVLKPRIVQDAPEGRHSNRSFADVLVPVPLHRRRLAWRQFNQASVLAKAISAVCGIKTEDFALQRIKPTPAQVGLTRNQRALNVQGAFSVVETARIAVEGRAVVLVDDVLTSGATINAAARALLRAGARSVDVLVFARVVTNM